MSPMLSILSVIWILRWAPLAGAERPPPILSLIYLSTRRLELLKNPNHYNQGVLQRLSVSSWRCQAHGVWEVAKTLGLLSSTRRPSDPGPCKTLGVQIGSDPPVWCVSVGDSLEGGGILIHCWYSYHFCPFVLSPKSLEDDWQSVVHLKCDQFLPPTATRKHQSNPHCTTVVHNGLG